MKKLSQILTVLLLLGAVVLGGCKETPKEKKPFVLKGDTWLYLNVEKSNMKAETEEIKPIPKDQNLTPRQIVTVACSIEALLKESGRRGVKGVVERMKDYENNRIKMDPYYIICPRPFMENGKKVEKFVLEEIFMTSRDVILIAGTEFASQMGLEPGEIIGYIPNAKMEEAEKAIREAWAKGDNEAVYKFFNDAYTFIPIRKGAYDELVKQGKN